jgi:hypothetical protein
VADRVKAVARIVHLGRKAGVAVANNVAEAPPVESAENAGKVAGVPVAASIAANGARAAVPADPGPLTAWERSSWRNWFPTASISITRPTP